MAKKSRKKESKNEAKGWGAKILGVLSGTALIVFCVCLVLGIAGYNPADESFNVSNSDKISNFMGRFGSYSADFIANSYGLAVFVFLIPVLVWGYLLIKHQKIIEFKIRLFALLLGIISLGGVFNQVLAAPLEKVNLLGKFSHLLPETLTRMFKSWGLSGYENAAVLALLSLMALMSFNLAAGITFKHWSRALRAIGACIYAVGLGIYDFARRLGAPRALAEPRTETSATQTKEKARKEPTLSSAPASEKEKARPAKNASAEVIAFAGRKGGSNGGYQYPDINLLKRPKEKIGLSVSEKELNETARALEGVLEEFGIHGEIVKIRPGPVVTLFELEPAPGTKTSRVISLADDIARSMSAVSVRIAVVPGSNTIGIEIPNAKREIVWLRDLLEDSNFVGCGNDRFRKVRRRKRHDSFSVVPDDARGVQIYSD